MEVFPQHKTDSPLLRIGENVQINDYVHIAAARSVIIGSRVLIASKVHITDHNHGCYDETSGQLDSPNVPPSERPLFCKAVIIEDDVWLGESAVVLPGVTIGRGSIIGALSTVTKHIPAYSIAVGSPAKVVKRYNLENKTWERV